MLRKAQGPNINESIRMESPSDDLKASEISGDKKCSRNFSVQRRKNCPFRSGELSEMAIRSLFCRLGPGGKFQDIVIVRNKREFQDIRCFQPEQ